MDIRLKSELLLFLTFFWDFFWGIFVRSYNTGQLLLLANQRLQFLLLVDSGYSVVLFYILVSD